MRTITASLIKLVVVMCTCMLMTDISFYSVNGLKTTRLVPTDEIGSKASKIDLFIQHACRND